IAQVVFSIVLLIAAGLVTQNLRNLEDQNFGFVTEGRLIVNIDPSLSGYTPDKLYGLYQRLRRSCRKYPEFWVPAYQVIVRCAAITGTKAFTLRENHVIIAGRRHLGIASDLTTL